MKALLIVAAFFLAACGSTPAAAPVAATTSATNAGFWTPEDFGKLVRDDPGTYWDDKTDDQIAFIAKETCKVFHPATQAEAMILLPQIVDAGVEGGQTEAESTRFAAYSVQQFCSQYFVYLPR